MQKALSGCMDSLFAVSPAHETEYLGTSFLEVDRCGRAAFCRPHKKVQLLIGMTSESVNCTDGMEAGKLVLNKREFHPGWVLTGCCDKAARSHLVGITG